MKTAFQRLIICSAFTFTNVAGAIASDPEDRSEPLANRLLSGTTTIDAGRHMALSDYIGVLTLDGGAASDNEATRITIHEGGYAQFSNGIRLTSSSGHTFNGAGQTHDLQVHYTGPVGSYSITGFKLPGAGSSNYIDASGTARQELGGEWSLAAEYGNVLGEKLNLPIFDHIEAWVRSQFPGNHPDYRVRVSALVETPQPIPPDHTIVQGAPWELARGSGPTKNERVNPLISAEVNHGSSLDLSGVEINITGTALLDRNILGGTINLGRRMVSNSTEVINRNDTITLSTFGSDDQRTRLQLASFDVSNEALSAVHHGPSDFVQQDSTADVHLSANFELDRSVTGVQHRQINVASSLSSLENGGAGLAMENVQSTLNVGYTWTNVENNTLISGSNFLIVDWASDEAFTRSYINKSVQRKFATDTHTAITFDNTVQTTDAYSVGWHHLGARTIRAIAEGLEGEDVSEAKAFFEVAYAAIGEANIATTVSGTLANGSLTEGSVISLTNTKRGAYYADGHIESLSISGSENLSFQIAKSEGDLAAFLGNGLSLTVEYLGDRQLQAGELSRISRGVLSLELA
jgi:hypothetical protein